MINNEKHSDVVFKLDSSRFYAHKYVLCSASDVFRRIFRIEEPKKRVQSLGGCGGWSKKRLQKVSVENINAGGIEGFLFVETRYMIIYTVRLAIENHVKLILPYKPAPNHSLHIHVSVTV